MAKEKKLLPLVVSLYSYRGGTGRTQLCANLAAYFCFEKKQKVLLWDWDMEAPSLHHFLGKKSSEVTKKGTIDLLQAYMYVKRQQADTNCLFSRKRILPCLQTSDKVGRIDLIPAGNYTDWQYARKVAQFDWVTFKELLGGFDFMLEVKKWLQSLDYDYILIDSRTGIADYSGICNVLLPDVNVFLITSQLQSFEGNLKIANMICNAPFVKEGHRKPYILPILSRMDTFVNHKSTEWIERFQQTFAQYYDAFFETIHQLNPQNKLANRYRPKVNRDESDKDHHWIYNDDTRVDYNSDLSFGENVIFGETPKPDFGRGFATNVEYISHMLENVKNPNLIPPNINYANLNNDKVDIDSRKYVVETDLKHNVLCIQIEKANSDHHYYIGVVLKTNYEGNKPLGTTGEHLLVERVRIQIPTELNELFWQYQRDLQTLESVLPESFRAQLQQQEKDLTQQFEQIFLANDINIIFKDFAQVFESQRIQHLLWVISAPDRGILQFPFELAFPRLFSHPNFFARANDILLHPQSGLVRTTVPDPRFLQVKASVLTDAPVKVLLVVSLADWQGTVAIDFAPMQQHLMETMSQLQKTHGHQLFIEFLYPASLDEMDEALRNRKHDVVHLSTFALSDKPALYLEDANGDLNATATKHLGSMLRQHESVKLLIINLLGTNPCTEVEQILADELPCIIVTRFNQSEALTTLFPLYFYENLLNGYDLTHALNHTRARLYDALKMGYFGNKQQFIMSLPIYAYLTRFLTRLIDPQAPIKPKKRFYKVRDFKPDYLIGLGFIGRRRTLIQMQNAFRAGQHLCLYGLGGMGKTVLASAFIHQYATQMRAEVVALYGGNQINPKTILDVFNQRLALIQPEQAAALQELLESDKETFVQKLQKLMGYYPKNGRLIILLDNCEDLLKKLGDKKGSWQQNIQDQELLSFLRYMCEKAPTGCQILLTSRYKMVDLEADLKHILVNKWSLEEQNRLLDQSPVLKKAIQIEERKDLYEQLDGHPRSYQYLEILLRRSKTFQWHQIQKVREQAYGNLLLEAVYERLTPSEKKVFEWAASFTTQTEIDILAELCQKTTLELLPFLETFQSWSLCRFDGVTFSIHYLTQEWLHRTLEPPKSQKYYHRIGLYFFNLLGKPFYVPNFNIDYAILAKSYFELANGTGLTDFVKTCFLLAEYYSAMGAYAQSAEVMRSVCEKATDEAIRSDAFNFKGILDLQLGKNAKAKELLDKSLAIREKLNDSKRISESYTSLGLYYKIEKDYEMALDYLEMSLKIAEANKNKQGIAVIYNNMSQIQEATKHYNAAKESLQKSMIIQHETNDFRGLLIVYTNLGRVAYQLGEQEVALNYLKQAIKAHKKWYDVYDRFKTLEFALNISVELKKYEEAAEYLAKAMELITYLNVPKDNIEQKLAKIQAEKGEAWLIETIKKVLRK